MNEKINELPQDIVELIKEFIPYDKLVFLNKEYYNKYHFILKNHISNSTSFIKEMIKRDNYFVFEQLIRENFDMWLCNKQYLHKNMMFNNFIYFVLHYSIENESYNCKEIIINNLLKRDLCKNLHKKKVVKYIKWKK